jgi:hypothetical protein
MADAVSDDVVYLIGQAELLFRRAKFETKRETVFKLKDSVEVVDLTVTSPAGDCVIVECRLVDSETLEQVKPLLSALLLKKQKLEEGRALLLTKPKKPPQGENLLEVNYPPYMKDQVFFWNHGEFMRLYSLKGEDLESWVHRRLSLQYQSKEKKGKEEKEDKSKLSDLVSLEGATLASGASTKDALLPAGMGSVKKQPKHDEGFFSAMTGEELMKWAVIIILVSVVVFYFAWSAIESLFSSMEAVCGGVFFLIVFMLLIGWAEKL